MKTFKHVLSGIVVDAFTKDIALNLINRKLNKRGESRETIDNIVEVVSPPNHFIEGIEKS